LYERAISDHNRTAERQKFRIIKIQDGGRISTEKLLRQMLQSIAIGTSAYCLEPSGDTLVREWCDV